MSDLLLHASPLSSAELRHEVPAPIVDPFLFGVHAGRAFAAASPLDVDGIRAARPDADVLGLDELGVFELLAAGTPPREAVLMSYAEACRRVGLQNARVPGAFPFGTARRLEAADVELEVDQEWFAERRRRKAGAELEGVRRAVGAAEAGLARAAQLLREARRVGDALLLDGEALTCERLREAVDRPVTVEGATLDTPIVSHGPQTALGHDEGREPIAADEAVMLDLWPRDRSSGCYADLTRTWVVGTPPPDLAAAHAACGQARAAVLAALRPA